MSPQSIAHYRITSKLGEGGMGAVYRATDTKLNRDVAIKVLPESFAEDPDRLARFTREAQVLASLNHPNIAAIYGVEERALVMELVEGQTLAGPLPLMTRCCDCPSAHRRAGIRARKGDRASRSEAGQHQGHARGPRKGAGFRPRQGLATSRPRPIRQLADADDARDRWPA